MTDRDATGIRPSSTPSNTSPRNAAARTAMRAALESSDGAVGVVIDMRLCPSNLTRSRRALAVVS